MKSIGFKYTNINSISNNTRKIIEKETLNIKESYTKHTPYAAIHVPFNNKDLEKIHTAIQNKHALNIDTLIVIGIGGSHMGTLAVHHALNGLLYNESSPPIKLYFADTTDVTYIAHLTTLVEEQLQQNKHVLINIVTKSGSTIETLTNAQIFIELLKRYQAHYKDFIVTTSDEGSPLDQWAQTNAITRLHVPKNVGGRYSVLTAVGLFPLGMVGIDINHLLAGAQEITTAEFNEPIEKSIATQTAGLLYEAYTNGYHIHDLFIFSQQLETFGKWYRQLMGESLGKPTISDPSIRRTFTPTVSVGSTDLHSVTQLYLGGLPKTITTFINIEKWRNKLTVPNEEPLKTIAPYATKKTLNIIMDAIFRGTYEAYAKQKKPIIQLTLPEVTPYYIGALLQSCILQMIYLGKLLDVNPFNQPQVELYKKETRALLQSS